MNLTDFAGIDEFLDFSLPEDDVLVEVRCASHEAGLPTIEVSNQQGKLLRTLVEMAGAVNILEVGTLGGYSTVCMAQGSPKATIVTLEFDPLHAEVARKNFALAGVQDRVHVLVGPALRTLPQLELRVKHRVQAPFDFVFIDADKENNSAYLDWAVDLTGPGATIVVDNVIRDGRVMTVQDKKDFIATLKHREELRCSVVQTVGSKGWDGFILARRV